MKKIAFFLSLFLVFSLFSCQNQKVSTKTIAVFVPGAVAGSPIYEQLVAGVKKAAVDLPEGSVSILEAGFNQAEWLDKLKNLAASGKWDFIVSSNPAIPELCLEVLKSFPNQKFIIADAYLNGNANIHTSLYNQKEQGYLAGYLAALIAKDMGKSVNLGVVIAQHYPTLDKAILPGFLQGAQAVAKDAKIDVRMIGNWFDANKAMELSNAMIDAGVSAILPVAGGATQGVIGAAKAKAIPLMYLDGDGYTIAPGVVLGCITLSQERLVFETVSAALKGTLEFGKAQILGVKDGYVNFDAENPDFMKGVSPEIAKKMAELVNALKNGTLLVDMEAL